MTIPISTARPPDFPGPPPACADVVVIGGGVIGVMAALHLAEAGQRVVLVEKGRIAGEQSGRNWGWIRQQGRDPAELPMMIEASAMWEDLDRRTGGATGFRRDGVIYLARDARQMERYEGWMIHARAHGLDTRMVGAAEVAALMPGHRGGWTGGILTPSDARAEPFAAVPALARLAAAAGVTLVEGCAARTLDMAAGRVAGVMTEAGRIACSAAVLAGGAWSALFLRAHGVWIPQLSVRSTVCATEPLPSVYAGNASDKSFAFRRRQDGGYSLAPGAFHEFFLGPDAFRALRAFLPQLRSDPFGSRYLPAAPPGYPDAWGTPRQWDAGAESPFERMRVLDPRPNPAKVEEVRRAFAAAFPALGGVRIARAWAGMIDTMPDVVPVIDHVPPLPGLTVATGLSGHGFGIGPAVGRVVAGLVTGRSSGHDLHRFRFGRFTDGSKVQIGPSL